MEWLGWLVVALLMTAAVSLIAIGRAQERRRLREALQAKAEAERIERERRRDEERTRLIPEAAAAYQLLERVMASLQPTEYLAQSEADAWCDRNAEAFQVASRHELADYLPEEQSEQFHSWSRQLREFPRSVRLINERFVERRMAEDANAFDGVEVHPLTEAQRRAIVTDEDTTLVVAGAGTGKTSTIVGKVDYLVRRNLAAPSEILVLAFNRQASEELQERLSRRVGIEGVTVSTFHALGLRVIAQGRGRKPSLSSFAEDNGRELKQFIRSRLTDMLRDSSTQRLIVDLLSRHLDEEREGSTTAKTGDEYIREQKELGLRAITGKMLKSHEEVLIANWLTLSGIRWEYERPYPVDTATTERRQYKPDFYLPDHDLYIEHFGIDRQGGTAPGVDAAEYARSMEWKRAIHQRYGTRLVETYSWFKETGGLIENLEQLLRAQGIEPCPLTEEQVAEIVHEGNRTFSDFVELIAQFLNVYKSNGADRARVEARARSERDHVFLLLFWRILDAYTQTLDAASTIDFNDMINEAREVIRSGAFTQPYRYIIVDEFQDISENRLGLLQDLRQLVPHGRLFVVGDDWQSIYRFTGSDVNIITDLPDRVGATARVDLDTTFRYAQELLDATSTFVQQNPRQLRKRIRASSGPAGYIPILVVYEHRKNPEDMTYAFHTIVKDLAQHAGGQQASVFVIGRYHRNKPRFWQELVDIGRKHRIRLEYHTAHASKGKEADYVIVVGLEAGEYGFPALISDDPVIDLVLVEEEPFSHAEERRLFYVAMTRARRRVYLVTPQDNASTFIQDDLLTDTYRAWVDHIGEISPRHRCPKCQGLTIRKREGDYGTFWSCTHYPLCDGKLNTCFACRTGAIVLESDGRAGRCTDCGHRFERCPRCASGYLREKTGRNGPFLGCSRWRQDGSGCSYTRNAGNPHHVVPDGHVAR